MAITGTLDTALIGKGPGLIYLGVTVPAAGAVTPLTGINPLTGVAGGAPVDGTLLGLTPEGNTVGIGYEQTSIEADEVTGPIYQVIETESLTIAGSAYQVENLDMLKYLTPTSTFATTAGTNAKLTFGGRPNLSPEGQSCILLSWASRSEVGKYMWFQLYKAINTDGTSFQVTRRDMTKATYNFQGQSIGTRLQGDQIGILGKEDTTP